MPIRVHCPSCDDRFVTSRRYRGKRVRCPVCRDWIKIRTSSRSKIASPADAQPTSSDSSGSAPSEDPVSLVGDDSQGASLSRPVDPSGRVSGHQPSDAASANGDNVLDVPLGPVAQRDVGTQETARNDSPPPSVTPEEGLGAPPARQPVGESSSNVLDAGFEDEPQLTSDIGLLAMDLEQGSANDGDEAAVPLDEPLGDKSAASRDVLAFLAASGGPDAVRAGAAYRPKDAATDNAPATPDATPVHIKSDQPTSPSPRRVSRTSWALMAAAVAVGLFVGVGADRIWILAFGGGPPDLMEVARNKSSRPSVGAAPPHREPGKSGKPASPDEEAPPRDPYADIVVVAAAFDVEDGWFANQRTIRLTIRNDGETPLHSVGLRASVVSGLFDSTALAVTNLDHTFEGGLAPGQSREFVVEPSADSPLATMKLPPNTQLQATVVRADRG